MRMKMNGIALGCAAIVLATGNAALAESMPDTAQQAAKFHDSTETFVVNGAAEDRRIDCHGHEAVISGASNNVELRNCSVVRVSGASNNVRAIFSAPGTVRVTGSSNDVEVVRHDDVRVRVSDNGTANRIIRR